MTAARFVAEHLLVPDRPDAAAPRGAVGLGWLLALTAAASSAATLWWPDLLSGPAVMNGSARGTALVVLALAVPLLVASLLVDSDRPVAAPVGAIGATAYLLYNAVLLTFATPFNHVFLLYVATLGFAFWSLVARVRVVGADGQAVPTTAHRVAASWILAVVVLNTAAWLAAVVPATLGERPTAVLDGTGLTTSPVYVQDLALWLPALAWVAWRLWHGRAGVLGAGALLFWTLEGASVAVDQWFGHRADPGSTVASAAVVPVFGGVAAVTAVVLWMLARELRGGPPAGTRGWEEGVRRDQAG